MMIWKWIKPSIKSYKAHKTTPEQASEYETKQILSNNSHIIEEGTGFKS